MESKWLYTISVIYTILVIMINPSQVTSVTLKRYFKRLKGTMLNTVRYGTQLSFPLRTVRTMVTLCTYC